MESVDRRTLLAGMAALGASGTAEAGQQVSMLRRPTFTNPADQELWNTLGEVIAAAERMREKLGLADAAGTPAERVDWLAIMQDDITEMTGRSLTVSMLAVKQWQDEGTGDYFPAHAARKRRLAKARP